MKFNLLTLSALVATVACTPVAMPEAFAGELVDARATSNNCTTYCSTSAGCVCTVRPSDCSALYTVNSGDTCLSIAQHFNNFTVTQFYRWNPDVGQTCFGLQAYVPVCINTPWYKYTPPVQPKAGTHYTPSQTPVPVMPNIISSCKSFELVASGTTVAQLAKENNFPVANFPKWNGNQTTAWADYWACVKA